MDKEVSYKISLILLIIWILIKVIKKIMNQDGISRYEFIQVNTIGYWLLISLSFSLSKYFFDSYLYFFIFFLVFLLFTKYYGMEHIFK